MKILFLYKGDFAEPIGIMYLSSFLKKYGHDCYFLDIAYEADLIKEIQKISPYIIAYSITTGKHKFYQQLNRELKKKFKFFAFFGGPHCTFFPEFIYEESVDAVCRGEGEFAFLELVNGLEKGKDITNIKNLWVKADGKVHKNEVRNLIENLDILPFPDRELTNGYKHYRKMHRRYIITGRGCPYKCSYCFNHSYNTLYQDKGTPIRRRSINNIIKELKSVKESCSPKRFQFIDDTFNLDHKWMLDFCEVYKKEISIPFALHMRVNLVKEEAVKALKDAGCTTVIAGIESGNEYLRNTLLKRNISERQIIDATNLFNGYGLKSLLQNIVGLPDETLDMVFETMTLNIKCRPTYSWVSIFQPYPGTDLCRYSKEKGYFNSEIDSFDESFFGRSVMKMNDIKKIERLRNLFSLTIAFPMLVPLIKILIKVPLNGLYRLLWHLHRGYCYLFKLKLMDASELFIRE